MKYWCIIWYNEGMKEGICSILGMLLTYVVYLLGGIDIAMQCLLIAIVLDYLSGMIKAFNLKQLSSKVGFKGVMKKVGVLLIVMLGVLVDRVTGDTGAIRTLVIYYFVANEGLSIIENLSLAGVPIPKGLKKALKALKEKGN